MSGHNTMLGVAHTTRRAPRVYGWCDALPSDCPCAGKGQVPTLPPPRALNADAALVARFMLECLPRCDGGEAMRGAVYKRFLRWCDEQSPPATAPNASAFRAHFEPLCGRLGIRLRVPSAVARSTVSV